MNEYLTLKSRHQSELNSFPVFFAFSKEQFEKGMKNFHLDTTATDKISSIGAGGFILKTDAKKLGGLLKRHTQEHQDAIDNDVTGDGFILDMFEYELANHEYIVTYSVDDTLRALGLTKEEVDSDPKLKYALKKAIKRQRERDEDDD